MDAIDYLARPAPTAQRPLLGVTVLLVEDSRFASEAVRLLAQRSGARLRRADSLASARRHLGRYSPCVAIVDLGLPDGSGLELIAELAGARGRPQVLLATSGRPASEVAATAMRVGADGFLAKPLDGLAAFQAAILHHLSDPELGPALRPVGAERVVPDRLALGEDLAFADRALADGRLPVDYVASFLIGLARSDRDEALATETALVARAGAGDLRDRLRALLAKRLAATRRAV
jgi:ActR/RegA family two-component response regulator